MHFFRAVCERHLFHGLYLDNIIQVQERALNQQVPVTYVIWDRVHLSFSIYAVNC